MAKRLSNEQTLNCLKLWREYGDVEAQTLLVVSNRGLVKLIANKHLNRGLSFDELESAGLEGLTKAINMFNYIERPIEGFSSYIGVAIENQMLMEIRKYKKHSHVLSFDAPLGYDKNGDELKIEDIIGTDAEKLLNDVINEMKIDVVKEALKCLTSRERQIILLRYGLDEQHRKTQSEIAEIFGCTRTVICRQEQKALMKMRHPRNTRKLKDFADD